MRRPHLLKPLKSCPMPSEAIWVDTETTPEPIDKDKDRHVLDFGYAAYRRTRGPDDWITPQWLRFNHIEDFWDWTEAKLHGKSKLYLFAHNWAFDAPVLDAFNVLPARGYTLVGSVIQSPPVILRWRKDPHTIVMIDTLNIWRTSLKKIGKSIGLPKLTMPPRSASQETWNAYGKRDVEIIMQAVMQWWRFLKDNELGGFAPTIAAQSMRAYRHRFMSHEILIDDNERSLNLARNALHGGRTECHRIGKMDKPIYYLDVNAQYAAIMRNRSMPRKLIGHYKNISLDEISEWIEHYCCVIKAHIRTCIPCFPIIVDDRLAFPTGDYIGYLSTPEIEYALKHKLIVKIYEASVYEKAVLFKDYMTFMDAQSQAAKKTKDKVAEKSFKMLMTNLYGKWAQKGLIYKEVDTTESNDVKAWPEVDAQTGIVYHMRQYAHIIEELEKETEARDSHPAIAAHVTAHGRMQIWGLMQGAGQGHYYYNDTDSIWVDKCGYERLSHLIHPTRMGAIKLEGIFNDVAIMGPKDYILDGKVTIKGIRDTATIMPDGGFAQESFSSLIGLIRKGDLSAPVVSKIVKHLKRQYKKGIVAPNGSVSPLVVSLDS